MDQTRFKHRSNNSNPKMKTQEMHQSEKTRTRRNEPVNATFLGNLNQKNKLQKEKLTYKKKSKGKFYKEELRTISTRKRKRKNKGMEVQICLRVLFQANT